MGSGGLEPFEHQVDHGDMDPGYTALGALLVILAQASASGRPGQSTLHHPPSGQHFEVVAIRFAFDHGEQPATSGPGPEHQPASVTSIPFSSQEPAGQFRLLSHALLVVCGIYYWWRQGQWAWLSLSLTGWLLILVVMLISDHVVGSFFHTRSMIWALIFLYIIMAVGLLSIESKTVRIILLCALFTVNIYGCVVAYSSVREPWNEVLAYVIPSIDQKDGVMICPIYARRGFRPYYGDDDVLRTAPRYSIRNSQIDGGYVNHGKIWLISIDTNLWCDDPGLADQLSDYAMLSEQVFQYGTTMPSFIVVADNNRYLDSFKWMVRQEGRTIVVKEMVKKHDEMQ